MNLKFQVKKISTPGPPSTRCQATGVADPATEEKRYENRKEIMERVANL